MNEQIKRERVTERQKESRKEAWKVDNITNTHRQKTNSPDPYRICLELPTKRLIAAKCLSTDDHSSSSQIPSSSASQYQQQQGWTRTDNIHLPNPIESLIQRW